MDCLGTNTMKALTQLSRRLVKLEPRSIIHHSRGCMRCFSFSMRFSESEDDDTEAAQSAARSALRTQEIQRIRGIGGTHHSSRLLLIESHRGNKEACGAIAATISKYRPHTLLVPIAPDSPMACKYFTKKGVSLPGETDGEQMYNGRGQGSRRAPTRRRKHQRRREETRRGIDGLIEGLQNRMDQVDIGVDVGSAKDFIENVILPQKEYTDTFLSSLLNGHYDRSKLKESERKLMEDLYIVNPSPDSLVDLTVSGEVLREYVHGPLFRRKESVSLFDSKYSVIYSKFEGSEELHRVYEDSLSAIFQAMTRNNDVNVVYSGMPTWALWLYIVNSRSKAELRELLLEIKSQARSWDEVYPLLCQYAPDVDTVKNLYSATVEQLVMATYGKYQHQTKQEATRRTRRKRNRKSGNIDDKLEREQASSFPVISLVSENQFDGVVSSHEKLRYTWDAWQYDGGRGSVNSNIGTNSSAMFEETEVDEVSTSPDSFRVAMNGSSSHRVSSSEKPAQDSRNVPSMDYPPETLRYDYHSRTRVDEVATHEALKLYAPGVGQNVDPRWYLQKLKGIRKNEEADEEDKEDELSRRKIVESLGEGKPLPVVPGNALTQGNLDSLLRSCTLQVDSTLQYSRTQYALTKHPSKVANRLHGSGKQEYQFSSDESFGLPAHLQSEDSRYLYSTLDKFGRLAWALASDGPQTTVAQADPCMASDLWHWWIKPFKVFPAYLLDDLFDETRIQSRGNTHILTSELDAMYRIGKGYTSQQRDLDDDPLRGPQRIKSKYSTMDPEDRQEINEMKNEWQNFGYPHMRFRSQH